MELKDNVNLIKGVGPKKAESLNRLGISSIEDLVYFLPKKYNDKRNVTDVSSLKEGEKAFIKVVVTRIVHTGYNSRKSPLIIKCQDKTGSIDIVFFNAKYLASNFEAGSVYTFYGRVIRAKNQNLQMVQPDYEKYNGEAFPGIEPVYSLTAGLSQKDIRKYEKNVLPEINIDEWLPETIVKENKLCDEMYALNNLHFPENESAFKVARYRMIFDELFVFQMGLSILKRKGLSKQKGVKLDANVEPFIDSLSFKLTPGQDAAYKEIDKDLESDISMNRLLQGDVGSGKTVIAQISAYKAAKSGFQSAIMAPTEILAKQHFESFKSEFEPFDISVGLLCSSMKKNEKDAVLTKLENGELDVLIGTHALIEDSVVFKNLGLIVTDEQHRFGVKQRTKLNEKGEGANLLVMTATPIPRTLAVILYGDLDSSLIKTMPVGRKPIITESYSYNQRRSVYSKVRAEIDKGHQAYVIAPLISESEELDVLSAEEIFEELQKKFSDLNVGLLHGNLKESEKDEIMNLFLEKKIDILVSTVVIEVGVNVPNATVMVIENSERFGLSQLHQLRGRVGRGDAQSYCFLVSKNQSEVSRLRNETLCKTTDGFVIAEEDLKLRGPGDFFGTKQHGLPELKNADLINHYGVLQRIKPQVEEILTKDKELTQNQSIKEKVIEAFGKDQSFTI